MVGLRVTDVLSLALGERQPVPPIVVPPGSLQDLSSYLREPQNKSYPDRLWPSWPGCS